MTATTDPLLAASISVPPVPASERWGRFAVLAVIAALLAWSYTPAEVYKAPGLVTYGGNMAEYLSGFLSPDFRYWRSYLSEMTVTVQIAIWGTVLAVILAVPFGLLSSNNIAPVWIVQPVRRLMDAFRAINELVFAVLFVVAVGLGPFAGVMALFISTTGTLAKLFSEAVEAIDPRPVEGIRATGATRLQEIVYGVIPQVLPLWTSLSLYRFEANVRSATVLGIVGAGGIGFELIAALRLIAYDQVSAILLTILACVLVVDAIGAWLRAKLK
jgi:phosphonate transport system permease protein